MLVPGLHDLQQLVLVVFFLPSTSANTLLALGGGGGGGGGGYSQQLALVALFIEALAHILHAQIATCTVMMVHGGGSGVMEVLPWDSSMWWLYINIIIFGHVTL